jgi:hypothetical protein
VTVIAEYEDGSVDGYAAETPAARASKQAREVIHHAHSDLTSSELGVLDHYQRENPLKPRVKPLLPPA